MTTNLGLAVEEAARRRGQCAVHPDETDVLRYERATDGALVCAEESRKAARTVQYWQPCDNHSDQRGWRNPYTRRNEYLCGSCHAASGDGVVQNKWAPRVSTPISPSARPTCEASGVVGTRDCAGEVRWRRDKAGNFHNLCNAHAGKSSAADPYADRK